MPPDAPLQKTKKALGINDFQNAVERSIRPPGRRAAARGRSAGSRFAGPSAVAVRPLGEAWLRRTRVVRRKLDSRASTNRAPPSPKRPASQSR
jgi:hypothetical protein